MLYTTKYCSYKIALNNKTYFKFQSLESLHEQATKYKDISLCDLIEAQYMTEQHKALKMLGDLHTNVTRAGSGSGLLILDHDLREYLKSKDDWKMYDIKEL